MSQLDLFGPADPAGPVGPGDAVGPAGPGGVPVGPVGPSADDALADGFAAHAARWAQQRGAPADAVAAVRHAARCVSRAVADGHVCVRLDEVADSAAGTRAGAARWRGWLQDSTLAGTPQQRTGPEGEPLPLIVDADGRLYLHRYFDYERRLAARLLAPVTLPRHAAAIPHDGTAALPSGARPASAAITAADQAGAPTATEVDGVPAPAVAVLRALFPPHAPDAVDWQQIAAALALRGRLTVVSGGPGTGKTTTVVNLLASLLAADPDARIALAAPTGKAAARMLEALRQRALHLPAAVRERLPAESHTVHRLLGALPEGGGFRHNAAHPLAIDVLVVDEASMLDLSLATQLFEAVPADARIVLLGDKDQLSAVESGAVFADLSADPTLSAAGKADLAALCGLAAEAIVPPAPATPTPLHDRVVWLRQNFRFAADSGIGEMASAIRGGDVPRALAVLREPADGSLSWIEDGGAQLAPTTWLRVSTGFDAYVAALREGVADVTLVAAAFDRFRVLCAVREGPRGVVAVNAALTRAVRRALDVPLGLGAASAWYPGRPVMVLRNDPVLRLYNGDIGLTLPDAAGRLMVWFADRDAGVHAVAPQRLPPHETAYATTVHKAQGSEFDTVLLLLPAEPNRVLSRELVYTGITRARSHAVVVGSSAVLSRAIESPTRRDSGLIARLNERVGDSAV